MSASCGLWVASANTGVERLMPLESKLFRGDPRLEACLISDPAHITPGSRGEHVAKIQLALNTLDNAGLKFDGIYGPATAQAVMNYKNDPSRRILQPFQTTADNIVGKRSIASLDREMLASERTRNDLRIIVVRPGPRPVVPTVAASRPSIRLGFAIPAAFAALVIDPNVRVGQSVRIKPRNFAELLIKNPGGSTIVNCVNTPPPNGDIVEKVSLLWDPGPGLPRTDRLVPEPTGLGRKTSDSETNGGLFFLVRKEDSALNLDGYRPGDATLTATNSTGQKVSVQVVVRADSAGPVARPPLTKLAPDSKFFSADTKDGGEFDPHNLGNGRPVNPNRGGRLINLGGEQETPEFEDYQVTLGFSGYRRDFFNQGNPVFRPMFDDTDPTVQVAPKSASHICIRGNPLTDDFIRAIRLIAKPGCVFTYSGSPAFATKAKTTLSGTVLEERPDGRIVIQL
jgi:peptidoglycan hydrolase-like protein with peptidoglycan-binding domain